MTTSKSKAPVAVTPQTTAVATNTESMYSDIVSAALNKDLDIDRLQQLIRVQDDLQAREAIKAMTEAHSRFQGSCPVVTKAGEVDMGRGKAQFSYARLEDVAEAIRPYLSENGLSYAWHSTQGEGGVITCTCTLHHVSGASRQASMSASPDGSGAKNGIQQIASTKTYLKRYTLLDVTGVTVGGEDDDGQAAGPQVEHNEQEFNSANIEFLSNEAFEVLLPNIRQAIVVKGKDAEQLIPWLERRKQALLTEEQKETILRLANESE